MISLTTLCAALALSQMTIASPAPIPTPVANAKRDMRPRYLREADSLPARGVYERGVITLPLQGGMKSRDAKTKRGSVVQVPIADDTDFSYVRAFIHVKNMLLYSNIYSRELR